MSELSELKIDTIMKNNCLILDGIAGAAKTSATVSLLMQNGIKYIHTTSTNKLKADIENRFGYQAYTTASALFQNDNGRFYLSEKECESEVIVIDEILQTSPKVFQWIENHPEKHIVICTDSKQMLAPVSGEQMLDELHEIEGEKETMRFSYSYRPANEETRDIYEMAYKADSDGTDLYDKLKNKLRIEEYTDEFIYTPSDVFLCHTNDIEKFMYRTYDLYNDYNNPTIIKKGQLATSKNGISKNHPILPQCETKGITSYYQIGNLCSVVRYQGSEVEQGHTLYYLINKNSRITNRECYTMLTRAKDFNDICVVIMPEQETRNKHRMCGFCGCEIWDKTGIRIKGVTSDNCDDLKNPEKYDEEINYAREAGAKEMAENKVVFSSLCTENGEPIQKEYPKTHKNDPMIRRLLKKEPSAAFSKTEDLYWKVSQIYFNHNWPQQDGASTKLKMMTNINLDDRTRREDFEYELDLYSAYPQLWYKNGILDGDSFEIADEDSNGKDKDVTLVVITTGKYKGRIVSKDLPDYWTAHGMPTYYDVVGYVNKLKTDKIGETIYHMAYDTTETKAKLKKMMYGYMQKPYLEYEYIPEETRKITGAEWPIVTRNPYHRYEIQLAYILSNLSLVMSKIRYAIYGNVEEGRTVVDALFFNDYDEEKLNKIKKEVHYDFRIKKHDWKNGTEEVITKTYPELKKRSHHKK